MHLYLIFLRYQTNNERLVNKDDSRHLQELYVLEHKRANHLFDIVEKLNIDAYEKNDN